MRRQFCLSGLIGMMGVMLLFCAAKAQATTVEVNNDGRN